jgi:mycofactocin precursor
MVEHQSQAVAFPGHESDAHEPPTEPTQEEDLVEADLLVEEISIDGMCGVY